MDVWGRVDDREVLGGLQRLIALGRNAQPALKVIAELGVLSTRRRFKTETGPDGKRWKPSLRAQLSGGLTLRKDGHLDGSISAGAGTDFAEWGVGMKYAAIHQFGGVIRAKGGALKFALPGGGFAVVKAVTMPARPYLGVNDDDRRDILDVFERHIAGVSRAG
jgi:phage virion morphogenesis protein